MPDEQCEDCDETMGVKDMCAGCKFYEDVVESQARTGACPNACNRFSCIVEGNCRTECEDLKLTQSPICVLCDHQEGCKPERRVALLGTRYMSQLREEKRADVIKNLRGVKEEHKYLERKYKELKDRFYKTSALWHPFSKTAIGKEGNKIRFELETVRKILDMLNIKYEKTVEIKPKGNK